MITKVTYGVFGDERNWFNLWVYNSEFHNGVMEFTRDDEFDWGLDPDNEILAEALSLYLAGSIGVDYLIDGNMVSEADAPDWVLDLSYFYHRLIEETGVLSPGAEYLLNAAQGTVTEHGSTAEAVDHPNNKVNQLRLRKTGAPTANEAGEAIDGWKSIAFESLSSSGNDFTLENNSNTERTLIRAARSGTSLLEVFVELIGSQTAKYYDGSSVHSTDSEYGFTHFRIVRRRGAVEEPVDIFGSEQEIAHTFTLAATEGRRESFGATVEIEHLQDDKFELQVKAFTDSTEEHPQSEWVEVQAASFAFISSFREDLSLEIEADRHYRPALLSEIEITDTSSDRSLYELPGIYLGDKVDAVFHVEHKFIQGKNHAFFEEMPVELLPVYELQEGQNATDLLDDSINLDSYTITSVSSDVGHSGFFAGRQSHSANNTSRLEFALVQNSTGNLTHLLDLRSFVDVGISIKYIGVR